MSIPTTTEVENFWCEVFTKNYNKVSQADLLYPDKKSLDLSFHDLDEINPEIAAYVCENAYECIPLGEGVLRSDFLREEGSSSTSDPLCIRISELPKDMRKPISKLKHDYTGSLVSVVGMVRKVTAVAAYKSIAVFKCGVCGEEWAEPQSSIYIQKPAICINSGCKGSGMAIRILDMKSKLRDYQEGEIQESPEGLKGGKQPQSLEFVMRGDLVSKITVGSKVILNGVLRLKDHRASEECSVTQFVLEVNSIEVEEEDMDEIHLTDDDIKRVEAISKRPDILQDIARSIAPSIHGLESVKLGIALQLAGGVPIQFENTSNRGDIHVLMIGDPGVAKSQLLKAAASIASRSVIASGKSASAAGLTATAQKDNDRWTVEAGALVLADGGLACVDELDKMRDTDKASMYNALEDQCIFFAKAGMTMTLRTKCSLLAAANPKYGRFNPEESIADQIDISSVLLSRFDLIYTLTDVPDTDKDFAISNHILGAHRVGEARAAIDYRGSSDMESILKESETLEAPISFADLRLYIAHARKFKPVLSTDAIKIIQDSYVKIRSLYNPETRVVPITARQIEGIVRLAAASAKLHFRHDITAEDATLAVHLVEENLQSISGSGGVVDIDTIMASVDHKKRDLIISIRNLFFDSGQKIMTHDEIVGYLRAEGFSEVQIKNGIASMCKSKSLFEEVRGSGNYRLRGSY